MLNISCSSETKDTTEYISNDTMSSTIRSSKRASQGLYQITWEILNAPKSLRSDEFIQSKFKSLIDDLGVEKADDLKYFNENKIRSIQECMKDVPGQKFLEAWLSGS